jgi:ABC-2 type transport system ATP-binding protein
MEEAAKVANRVAVIDHGKIIATGTVEKLMKDTKTKTLEDAFLALTGHEIRDDAIGSQEAFRMHHQTWVRH